MDCTVFVDDGERKETVTSHQSCERYINILISIFTTLDAVAGGSQVRTHTMPAVNE